MYVLLKVHFFLKRRDSNLTEPELSRLNLWALGLRVLAVLPLPWQQRCSALHEHPQLIVEVLLMRKQLQSASMVRLTTRTLFLYDIQKQIIHNIWCMQFVSRFLKNSHH